MKVRTSVVIAFAAAGGLVLAGCSGGSGAGTAGGGISSGAEEVKTIKLVAAEYSKDNTKAWRDWMLDGVTPPKVMGQCDLGALNRTAEMGRKYKINGTPAIVFEDGKRVPGAMNAEQIEKQLVASRSARP